MWQRLKNFFAYVRTYADLSPDVQVTQRVRRYLQQRPPLSVQAWFDTYWTELEVSPQVVAFVCTQLSKQTGVDFCRVQPSDRLAADLRLPLICWFDWETVFCEAFQEKFGVDLSDRFNPDEFNTVQDLVTFLDQQLVPVNCSSLSRDNGS